MAEPLKPGTLGTPLPAEENVFRLVALSKDGKVPPNAFELSDDDKNSELKAISVFAIRLTAPRQSLALMGENSQNKYTHYALLNVDAVRMIRPSPDSPAVAHLDVQWDPLAEHEGKPGADGHAGITGLGRPDGLPDGKSLYRSLRSNIADLANNHISEIA